MGPARLGYPDAHIESDNRLAWYLGRLDARFGDDAFYVHLKRDRERVVQSYSRRNFPHGIMQAFRGIMIADESIDLDPLEVANEVCETIDTNIAFFLRDKSHVMRVCIEDAEAWFPEFWERIGAEGDREAALIEFSVRHNAAPDLSSKRRLPLLGRIARKGWRIVNEFPDFVMKA